MKMKDRLSLLASGTPPSQGCRTPSSSEEMGEQESSPRQALDGLRAKLSAALGPPAGGQQRQLPTKSPSGSLSAKANGSEPLPFVDVPYGGGQISQRKCVQTNVARVGRMPLSSARESRSEILALLALDPSLEGVDFGRALYFDTETTGLGGAGTCAFLIGLGWHEPGGGLVLEQLLLRDPACEAAQLARFSALVKEASCLVSFNGKSFDWPLLKSRMVMTRSPELPQRPHFDLLHVSRRLHGRRLKRCRLVDLEAEVLGFQRPDTDIPGADIPPLYGHFLRTGDEEALRPVVEHNAWDVLSMAALVGLYGEPLAHLTSDDLVGLGNTLKRARAFDLATSAARSAMNQGSEIEGRRLLAQLNKARGDRARALCDFEILNRAENNPTVRLELSKLYEHHARDFARALEVAKQGTGESQELLDKREARLVRRAQRKQKGI